MTFVKDAVVFLDKLGMWDIVLPFIFVFTIVYAVLEKTKVLGQEDDGTPKHRFNALASFVIGFFVLIAVDTLNIINRFSQWMVLLILMGVSIAILFSFFGFKDIRKVKYGKLFMPIAFIIFGFVVLYAFGWLQFFDLNALRKYEGIIIGIIFFFIIMWIILREPKKAEKEKEKKAEEKKPAPEKESAPKPKHIDLGKLADALPPKVADELMDKATAMGGKGPIIFEDLIGSLSDEAKAEIRKKGFK